MDSSVSSQSAQKQLLPGNGNAVIGVEIALKVIIMGEADHLMYTFEMKKTESTNTIMNITTKKPLKSKETDRISKAPNKSQFFKTITVRTP